MPGLVVYAMGSPFKRQPVVEYVYGPASVEALDPYTPLLVEEVYDNKAIVLVADIYSVWPEVGAFPHSETYTEVLDRLEKFMEKTCSRRASPRICRRVSFKPVPWHGLMGAWRFTATFGDTTLFTLKAIVELGGAPRTRKIYFVVDEEGDAALKLVALRAVELAATILGAEASIVVSEPKPYPLPSKPTVELHDYETIEPTALLRRELAVGVKPPKNPLKTVTPAARLKPDKRLLEAYQLTTLTAVMASNSMITPLFYQACGARDPLGKLKNMLRTLAEAYTTATQLSKKPVGGVLRHHVAVDAEAVRALALGTAIERLALNTLKSTGIDCTQVYSDGVDVEAVEKLEETLKTKDKTPQPCLKRRDNKLALQEGCLKKLRTQLSETQ